MTDVQRRMSLFDEQQYFFNELLIRIFLCTASVCLSSVVLLVLYFKIDTLLNFRGKDFGVVLLKKKKKKKNGHAFGHILITEVY